MAGWLNERSCTGQRNSPRERAEEKKMSKYSAMQINSGKMPEGK